MRRQINHAAAAAAHAELLAALANRALRLPRSDATLHLTQHGLGNAETVRRCTTLMRAQTQVLRDVAQRPGFDPDYGSYTAHPLDPRTPEPADDELSDDEARDEAVDQVLATPELMANWLAFECSREAKPVDVQALTEHAVIEASVPALLAVLLSGDDRHASRALHRLRELAIEQNAELIDQRAASLLRHQRGLQPCAA